MLAATLIQLAKLHEERNKLLKVLKRPEITFTIHAENSDRIVWHNYIDDSELAKVLTEAAIKHLEGKLETSNFLLGLAIEAVKRGVIKDE